MSIDGGLRTMFHHKLQNAHWQAVETGGTGRGIPDSNACWQGHEFWIEFKRTSTWRVDLRPEQVGWIWRRVRSGGECWIAVRRTHNGGPVLGVPIDILYLVNGQWVRELAAGGLSEVTVRLTMAGGPSEWDWSKIGQALFGGAYERAG
jgi:hypothetical protein